MTNEISSVFFIVYVFKMFLIFGLFFGLMGSLESKMEIFLGLIYPFYLYAFMAAICFFGQYLMDSVSVAFN